MPRADRGDIEGDGETVWRVPAPDDGFTFVVPNGMRVGVDHLHSFVLIHRESGSWLRFPTWGPEDTWKRRVYGEDWRVLDAMFNWIEATAYTAPHASQPDCLSRLTSYINWPSWRSAEDAFRAFQRLSQERCGVEPWEREKGRWEIGGIVAGLAALGMVITLAGAASTRRAP